MSQQISCTCQHVGAPQRNKNEFQSEFCIKEPIAEFFINFSERQLQVQTGRQEDSKGEMQSAKPLESLVRDDSYINS